MEVIDTIDLIEQENKIEKIRKKKKVDEKKIQEKVKYYKCLPTSFLIDYFDLKKK